MTNLRLIPPSRKQPAEPPAPDTARDEMLELMHVYRSALVRARFLQPRDHLDPADDEMTALGGRFTRRAWRRSA